MDVDGDRAGSKGPTALLSNAEIADRLASLAQLLCELSAAVRRLEAVALRDPVMPVVDGFFG
jgi:hypothetical protein